MKDLKYEIKGERRFIEVYFRNETKVGTIRYDDLWRTWRIEFEKGIRLSKDYILEIYKYMRKLK